MAGQQIVYQAQGPFGPIDLRLSPTEARVLAIQLIQQATQLLQHAQYLDSGN